MSKQNPIIYTHAQIVSSEIVPDIIHIRAHDVCDEILVVLTQQEFVDQLKNWLLMQPMEQRQMVIDELVACTLRTLELEW